MTQQISRRGFMGRSLAAGAALAAPAFFTPRRAQGATNGRVVILGFDGAESTIIEEMLERGDLPHLAGLRDRGTFARLGSTIPPQSPVAWSSFMTSKNPGGHNIYDFIRRDPAGRTGPVPLVGTGSLDHAAFSPTGELEAPPQAQTFRKGTPFWSVADEQDARCKILNVPFAFPADPLRHGVMLCGLGTPDVRGGTSTYFALSDSFTTAELGEQLSGGTRMPLEFDRNDAAELPMPGPRNTRYRFNAPQAFAQERLRLRVDRTGRKGSAEVDGRVVELEQGAWSEWLEWRFELTPEYAVRTLTRFYPLEIGERVRIYMTCQQFHPEDPYAPFTHPDGYAAELSERYGMFKTIGWAYDTHAMRQNDLDEDAFLADVRQTMAWRERLTLDELDRGNFDILVSAWTAPDRVGHMFWRYRDPRHPMHDPEGPEVYRQAIEETYRKADAITGQVLQRLRDDDLLMVMSDHGFETYRVGFNINTWLHERGYLALSNRNQAAQGFLMGIDWSQTKAYAIGLGSIYLNIEGRESGGIVAPDDAENVIAEIRDALLHVTDTALGNKVFSNVYTRADFHGEAIEDAPDLSLGYGPHYQNTKEAARGAIGEGLYDLNADKWSGEHAASDYARLPGILFANRPIEATDPSILDLGPTALAQLGLDIPSDFEGQALI